MRQPFLQNGAVALQAPSQVWSRADGDIVTGVEGLIVSDVRVLSSRRLTVAESSLEPVAVDAASADRLVFTGLLRGLDGPGADPRVPARDRPARQTLGRVLFDSAAGYALARLQFRGRGAVFAGLIAVMAVPGVVLLIPKFLVLNQLGMYDSYSGMIIPLFADAAGVFIMKNFFESIPVAVEEAARLDGAGVVRTFWSVILPMARPALITITILSFQGSWNELSHFVVSTSSPDPHTLTKGVASLVTGQLGGALQYPLRLAAAAVMTIPVAVLFVIFQKRITGTAAGAIKE